MADPPDHARAALHHAGSLERPRPAGLRRIQQSQRLTSSFDLDPQPGHAVAEGEEVEITPQLAEAGRDLVGLARRELLRQSEQGSQAAGRARIAGREYVHPAQTT